jgi:hypothetical protein
MKYRYHPILEDLKVNEDGTDIVYKTKSLDIKIYARANKSVLMKIVNINHKTLTTMRLVCECWHGMPENPELVVKKIDQQKGEHYSNLCWSKHGVGVSHNSKSIFNVLPKFTEAQFIELMSELKPKEDITKFLKRKKVSTKAYYSAKKRYEQKNK